MKEGRASRTAEYMALFRALENARPARTRRCEDPLARAFLTPGLAFVAWLARIPGVADLLGRYIDVRFPGTRTSAVARTRWIDDALRRALADAPAQLVILGAGFDSRAWRLPWPVDRLTTEPEAVERAAFLRRLAEETRRIAPAK